MLATADRGVGAKQVADTTGVGYGSVLAALKAGQLPGRNFGGRSGWRTTWAAVEAWIAAARDSAAPSLATREAWLEQRRGGVGGSDIAALAGVHPYKTALDVWLEKQAGVSSASSARMKLGSMLEGPILELYEKQRGVKVARPGLIHGRAPHELGTPDGLVVNGGPVVEVKTCDTFSRSKWGEPGEENAVRADAYCQSQWYCYLGGRSVAHVVVFDVDRAEDTVYVVERSDRAIDAMRSLAAAFWRDNVLAGVPPLPANDDSDEAWARISSALGNAYRGGAGALVGDATLLGYVVDYDKARAEAKQWEDRKDAAAARIKATLGDHEFATIDQHPEWSISWKPTSARVNHSAVADALAIELEKAIGREKAEAERDAAVTANTGKPTRTLNVRTKEKK